MFVCQCKAQIDLKNSLACVGVHVRVYVRTCVRCVFVAVCACMCVCACMHACGGMFVAVCMSRLAIGGVSLH